MTCQLEERSQALRAEADALLWGIGLHPLLERYGQARVSGSHALDLMVWRDLDIYLVNEDLPLAGFFHLGGQLAELLTPARMHFRNERATKTQGLPVGLYWGVYLGNEREGAWKIDIWAVAPAQFMVLETSHDHVQRRLTAAARRTILEIKAQCWMKPGYRRTFSSWDIYEAVLDQGVVDLGSFDAYLKSVKGCTIET